MLSLSQVITAYFSLLINLLEGLIYKKSIGHQDSCQQAGVKEIKYMASNICSRAYSQIFFFFLIGSPLAGLETNQTHTSGRALWRAKETSGEVRGPRVRKEDLR